MSLLSSVPRIENIGLYVCAHIVIGLFFCLDVISFSLPGITAVKPFFLLAAVYFWSIYRPTLLSAIYVFALGVMKDLLAYEPFIGVTALILLCVHWLVSQQRLFFMGQPFVMIWLGFIVTVLGAGAIEYGIGALFTLSTTDARPLLIGMGLNIVLFPVIMPILNILNRYLPQHKKGL